MAFGGLDAVGDLFVNVGLAVHVDQLEGDVLRVGSGLVSWGFLCRCVGVGCRLTRRISI